MFDRVARRADRGGSGFIGCPYVSARLNLPGDDHPAAPVVVAHKDGMLRELAALLAEIGVPDPEQRAQVVLMLLDGAVVHSVIRGNGDPLRERAPRCPESSPLHSRARSAVRRSSESEEHLAVTVAPGGVRDRLAVIRERIGRLDGRGERAVGDQGGELW